MDLNPDKFEYDMMPTDKPITDEQLFSLFHRMGDNFPDPEDQKKFLAWKVRNNKE